MTHADLIFLFAYNRWANARTLSAAARLTPDQLTRDLGNSFASVRDTLVHIYGAEWIWLARWKGTSPTTAVVAADVPDVAALRAAFPRARAAGAPALLVLAVAFNPDETIPPYSERPEEIRARFRV